MNILGCVPVSAPGYHPGTGYTITHCDGCQMEVWIGPNQARLRSAAVVPLQVLCPLCMVPHLHSDTTVTALSPTANSHLDVDALKRGIAAGWDPRK